MHKRALFFRTGAILLSGAALALSNPATSAGEVRPKSAPIIGVPYVTEAPIVMLKDLDSGRILFSRGADQRFTPASMAKVMTAYVVIDLIEKGELSRDKLFTVEEDRKSTRLNSRH